MKRILTLALLLAVCLMLLCASGAMAASATGTRTYTISYDSTNGYALNGSDGSHYTIGKPLTQGITTFTAPMSDVTITVTSSSGNIQIGTSTATGTEYQGFDGKNYTFSFKSSTYIISNVKLKSVHRNLTVNTDNNSKTCTVNWERNSTYEVEQIEVTLIPSTYSISYVLNGGTNAASNASTYTNGQDTILAAPARAGYAFDGWFDNPNFTGSAIASIPAGSEGNRTFYAKWKNAIEGLTFDEANGWFIINSASALNTLSAYSQSNNCSGMTFKQTANITLSGSFTGIGCYNHRFSGTYDGGNHTITGLYEKQYVNYLGLFLMTNGATIRNVRLVNPYIDSSNTAGTRFGDGIGGLIGSADNTTVSNCYVLNPTVKGEAGWSGAIIGWGSVSGNYYYTENDALPAVGRGNSTATRLRKLTLSDGVTASGDGVKLTYGGAVYCAEGEAVTLTVDPGVGYALNALTVNGSDVTGSVLDNAYDFIVPANDATATAAFTRQEYAIAYELDGGTNPAGNPATYNVDSDAITLAIPTRAGYAFEGWTGSNGSAPQKTVTILHGSTGDRTYTAHWMPDYWGINAGNDGSAAHPYTVSSADGLNYLATYVNSGRDAGGLHFVQTADIALRGTFTPIGGQNGGYNATAFAGTYDGGGHSITGLSVSVNAPYAGLFGYIQGGTVRNVTVICPNVRASYSNTRYAGGIAGCMKPGYLENCKVIDPTLSATYGGAICGGICARSSTISNYCYYAAGNVAAVGMNNLQVPITGSRVYKITTGEGITASAESTFAYNGTSYYASGTTATLGHTDRAGYDFSYAVNGVTVTDDQFAMPAQDVNVTAVYTPIVYTIAYNAGEGAEFSTEKTAYTIENADITLDQPAARMGYTFGGWYDNAALAGDPVTAIAKGSTGNVELWAKWVANTYTIHFEPVIPVHGTMADQTFAYDQAATALTSNAFYTTTGEWLGWNTAADGSGTDYADGQAIQNLTANDGAVITLYAQWHLMHRFNYDSSVFRCVNVDRSNGNQSEVYWAYEGETVKVEVTDGTSEYTIYVTGDDGTDITFNTETNTFTMPDQEVHITFTSVKKMAYTTIYLDDFESWDDVAYLYDPEQPAVTPAVVVKNGKTVLTEGTDYTLSITGNTGSANRMVEATVTVTGMGGYVGTNTKTFRITPFNIANCEVRGDLEIIDDTQGSLYPLMEKVQVWNGNVQLKGETVNDSSNVDFTVEIDYPESYYETYQLVPGEYDAHVMGRGDWTGKKAFSFTVIEPRHIVVFDANGGTGTMENDIVTKTNDYLGFTYTLPECGFTAPYGKAFDHWEASCEADVEKQPGNYFTAPYIWGDSDVQTITVTAFWREKAKHSIALPEQMEIVSGIIADGQAYEDEVITFRAKAGYTASSVTANGASLTHDAEGIYTVTVTEDVTVTASFTWGYTVAIADGITHGTVTADVTRAIPGETVTLTVTPTAGYMAILDEESGMPVTVTDGNGAPVYVHMEYPYAPDDFSIVAFTFDMPASDVTVSAAFMEAEYGIIIVYAMEGSEAYPHQNGSVAVTADGEPAKYAQGDYWAKPNQAVTVTVSPAPGYALVRITGDYLNQNGELQTLALTQDAAEPNRWIFTMPDGQPFLEAHFRKLPVVTFIDGETEYARVAADETGIVTPPEGPAKVGFQFAAWVQTDDQGVETTFDFNTPITQDVILRAKYAALHSVTVSVSGGGTITASLTAAIAGKAIALEIEPAAGYALDTLTVTDGNGNPVEVENEAFIMPDSDAAVSATFRQVLPPFGDPDFTMPAALKTIEESAFEGMPLLHVVDAGSVTAIGKGAFKDTGLTQIKLPQNCQIDADAFEGCGTVYVFAPAGGSTEAFCDSHDGVTFVATP